MKKFITLLLVLTGMVCTVSADELTTVYLKPGTNWSSAGARFAMYMYSTTGSDSPTWVDFSLISSGLYYAYFNKKYDKMIICRMNPDNATNSFGSGIKWNQTADLNAPSPSTPVYFVGESSWDDETPTPVSIDASGSTIHKIYVQDMENSGQTPYFYEYQNSTWYAIDNAWPGTELTTETIEEDTWYVFKTLKTSVLGRFMQAWNNGSNFAAGGIEFDLSSSDLQYNYYPSVYQSILSSEALSTPAILHFRSNNGASTLKHYFWNNDGINDEGFTTTSAGGATDWVTITTYKPSLSIQFYTYNNGDTNTDKSDGIDITGLTGGENYYYFAKLNANDAMGDYRYDGKGIMKMQDSYYLVYADGWDFDPTKNNDTGTALQTVGAIQLTANAENNFLFEGALDNTSGAARYYAIVPASDWNGSAITAWGNLISPSHPASTSSKYTIDAFEVDECDVMPTTWTRWYISNVNEKFNISFNFATMQWSSEPYIERTINPSVGYATFSSAYNVAIPEGVTAWYAKEVTDGKVVMKKFENGIASGQGVLLQGAGDVKFTPATSTDDLTSNLLYGTVEDTPLTGNSTAPYQYILGGNNSEDVGFYYVNTDRTSLAGKAYLRTEVSLHRNASGARAAWVFDDDDVVTGINEVKNTKAAEGYYNIAGQRVAQPTKGLYIVNGKKVIIK